MQSKTSISKVQSYKEIGEFWDKHDATEFGEEIDVEFDINIHSQIRYYPIDNNLRNRLKRLAEKRGISEATLINLWIHEKINQIDTNKKTTERV